MALRGRRGGALAREDEPRRDERAEQQAPAPQGPVLPPPPPVDYGVFMQGLVQAMQTQAHTQAALQAQLEAQASLRMRLVAFDHRTLDEALSAACRQEGEMEKYLEEKKASKKRPAATFQRQDKKKVVYQTPQRSVAVGSSQVPSVRSPGVKKECPHCGKTHGGTECWMITGKCLKCGSSDHKIKDCPRLQQGVQRGAPAPAAMKDYDAILGLDWLEEHYALVDCRRKRIVFRIPGEDEFSHPLPRNLAGKLVISAMKAMRMVNKGCDAFLASVFWLKARLASISVDVNVVSASTLWTPTLSPASSDVNANFSDLHALQTQNPGSKLPQPLGSCPQRLIRPPAASRSLLDHRGRHPRPQIALELAQEPGGRPSWRLVGNFLGQTKESFTKPFDPFGVYLKGKYPTHSVHTHYLLRRTGVVGDETLVEETLETDSKRGD
ncbi:hypothetical protein Taro_016107 [Colocasia esculenta]|uniref:CCHC-type domain-containing protein n=1 Tax=Colocasia esculenta TaxID=4460 RepID=A0A843UP75_COLES|nr:hypothetical protein [Colocasia esculenta]